MHNIYWFLGWVPLTLMLSYLFKRRCASGSRTLCKTRRECCRLDYVAKASQCRLNEFLFTIWVVTSIVTYAVYAEYVREEYAWTKADTPPQGRTWTKGYDKRITGKISALLLAFIMLPINRQALWMQVFGVAYGRALKMHRVCARLFVTIVVMHLILLVTGYGYGVLGGLANIYGEIALAMCILMLITTWLRRKYFEWFCYTHYLFIPVLFFSMLHINAKETKTKRRSGYTLYVILVPIILYLIDRIIRLYRIYGNPSTVVSAEFHKEQGVTALRIQKPGFTYSAGSYVYIRCPTLSKFQWHPFSISSCPTIDEATGQLSDKFTLHIKDMGEGTWTNLLGKHVSAHGKDLDIDVGASYETVSLDLSTYKTIVLCAGGIGVTPLKSIASYLAVVGELAKPKNKQRVVLFWVVRTLDQIAMFQEEMASWATRVEVRVHVTRETPAKDPEAGESPLSIAHGRPDWPSALDDIPRGSKTALLACGPSSMVIDLQNLARERKNDFHSETFFF